MPSAMFPCPKIAIVNTMVFNKPGFICAIILNNSPLLPAPVISNISGVINVLPIIHIEAPAIPIIIEVEVNPNSAPFAVKNCAEAIEPTRVPKAGPNLRALDITSKKCIIALAIAAFQLVPAARAAPRVAKLPLILDNIPPGLPIAHPRATLAIIVPTISITPPYVYPLQASVASILFS